MKKKNVLKLAVMAGVLSATPLLHAAGASGQAIAFTCNGCHGTDGDSQGSAPALQGEDAQVLMELMMDFKSGKEKATIMDRIAKGYTDEEIAAVSKYYAAIK